MPSPHPEQVAHISPTLNSKHPYTPLLQHLCTWGVIGS